MAERKVNNGATLGFEETLWQAAGPMSESTEDRLRGARAFQKQPRRARGESVA